MPMINCPKHGLSTGDRCISCLRDYAAEVWPIHARYWRDRRPNTPQSFYEHERYGDLPVRSAPSDTPGYTPNTTDKAR